VSGAEPGAAGEGAGGAGRETGNHRAGAARPRHRPPTGRRGPEPGGRRHAAPTCQVQLPPLFRYHTHPFCRYQLLNTDKLHLFCYENNKQGM